jgi:excisionase family DNA binding protein
MSKIILEQIEHQQLVNEITTAVLSGVREIIKSKEQSTEDKENWTIDETADYLKVSKVTIHSYVRQGILKKYKIGAKTLFKKSEVLASIKAQKSIEI